MGYSSRYHAASLAAVFVALAIGILIGAALGSDVVSGTAENLENDLAEDLDRLRAENAELEEELGAQRELGSALYPAVVGGRLTNQRVALIGLGDVDAAITADVRAALEPSGATLAEVAAIREPPDARALVNQLGVGGRSSRPPIAAVEQAARRAAWALTGRERGFGRVRDVLLSRFSGSPRGIDGVVVVRSRPDGLDGQEARQTDALERGMIAGLELTDMHVVGAERSGAEPSTIEFFEEHDVASVDSVDLLSGKVALVLALDGAEGSFGVKDTADSLLPELIDPARGGS